MNTHSRARLRGESARGLTIGYLHTLDGKPAYFNGTQLVFAEQHPHWQDLYDACRVVTNLDLLLAQQEQSERYRVREKWDVPTMGYVVVGMPRGAALTRHKRG